MNEKNWAIGLLTLIVFCAGISGCQPHSGLAEAPQPAASESPGQRPNQSTLDIKSIEFFGGRGAGAKSVYDRLEVNDASKTISPERFDIVLHVENMGRSSIQKGDLILMTTMEFVVAPGDPRKTDIAKLIKESNWSRDVLVDDVKMVLIPFLEVGKTARIEFTDFDLSKTNKMLSDRDTIERVWAIKVVVHVLNRKMVEVLQREAMIAVSH